MFVICFLVKLHRWSCFVNMGRGQRNIASSWTRWQSRDTARACCVAPRWGGCSWLSPAQCCSFSPVLETRDTVNWVWAVHSRSYRGAAVLCRGISWGTETFLPLLNFSAHLRIAVVPWGLRASVEPEDYLLSPAKDAWFGIFQIVMNRQVINLGNVM